MKTAVIYWSGTGNTEAMAKAVAEGAGAECFAVSEFSGNVEDYDAHCKQKRKVIENGASRFAHYVEYSVKHTALIDEFAKMIGFDSCGVGERAAYSKKQTRHRQQCDREHERASHTLQYAENFILHNNNILQKIISQSNYHYGTVNDNTAANTLYISCGNNAYPLIFFRWIERVIISSSDIVLA